MRKQQFILFNMMMLTFLNSWAGNAYLSLSQQPDSVHAVTLENTLSQSTTVFLQSRKEDAWVFRPFVLGAKEKKKITLEGEFGPQLPWLNIKTRSDSKVTASLAYHHATGSGQKGFNNTIGTEIYFNKFYSKKEDQIHLFVSNISPLDGEFQLISNLKKESHKLKGFSTTWLAIDTNTTLLRLVADFKIKAHLEIISDGRSEYLHGKDGPPLSLATPDGTYFLLTHRSYPEVPESFVVRIKDPELIAKAREQISRPDEFMARILVASIESGSGQYNRNMTNPGRAPWAWRTSEVYGFAELASQACDGNPQMVEENLTLWTQSIGRICFWNYNITRELSSQEVSKGIFNP